MLILSQLLLFVALPLATIFGVTVAIRFDPAKRPRDVTAGRWLWLTAVMTGKEWVSFLHSIPGRLSRDPEPPGVKLPRMVAPPRGEPLPLRPSPAAPLPPMPPVAPRAAPDRGLAPNGVPPDWAALAARVADSAPEDDNDWRDFLFGEARGIYEYAEAWLSHIDILANGLRLDPAVLQAAGFHAEMLADMAEGPAVLVARLEQAYALPYQHLDEGGTLPDAPDWLTPGAP